MKTAKKYIGLCLAAALVVSGILPASVFAAEEDTGLCEHHSAHTECGYVEARAEVPCAHACSDDSDCVKFSDCKHTHDGECGYVAAQEEKPCGHLCLECAETEPVCTGLADCPTNEHGETCEKLLADKAAAEGVATQIGALPTVEQIMAKGREEQALDYQQVQAAYTAYEALTAEQKALLPPAETVFRPYFDYFNSLVQELPENDACGENLTWSFDETTGTLTIAGTGAMTDYSATAMAPWYDRCSGIRKVEFTGGITHIGRYAFFGCSKLTGVKIPDSVTDIGDTAFFGCSGLARVTIPHSVAVIGKEAFYGCSSLSYITIPHSVTDIGDAAFFTYGNLKHVFYTGTEAEWQAIVIDSNNTNLTDVTRHCGVTGNPVAVNSSCTETVYQCTVCQSRFAVFTKQDAEHTYEDGVCSICGTVSGLVYEVKSGSITITDYNGTAESLTIPAAIGGIPVTGIGSAAFSGCGSLKNVTIPASVTGIGRYAFSKCGQLASITIPDSVTAIGDHAFAECGSLTGITIPDSVTELGDHAFFGCGSLKSVAYPASLTGIGNYTFYGCGSLTGITIPASVTSIGKQAFAGCGSLASLTIPDSVRSIGDHAFSGCGKLTKVTISGSVTKIGNYAFSDCGQLVSVIIPDSVTRIGEWAFSGCGRLTYVTLPGSVTDIAGCAFYGCDALEHVFYAGAETEWKQIAIGSYNTALADAVRHCEVIGTPVAVNSSCTETVYWCTVCQSRFAIFTKQGAEHTYEDGVCSGCGMVPGLVYEVNVEGVTITDYTGTAESLTIPAAIGGIPVTGIGSAAFSGCGSLKNVTIPASVTEIGDQAFAGCSLTDVYYGGSGEQWNALENRPEAEYVHSSCPDGQDHWQIERETVSCTVNGSIRGRCACGHQYETVTETAPGHSFGDWFHVDETTKRRDCGSCGAFQTYDTQTGCSCVTLERAALGGATKVWVDGIPCTPEIEGDLYYVNLPAGDHHIITAYGIHNGGASDVHTQYPNSMKVWVTTGEGPDCQVKHISEFDDLLLYRGTSIRMTGVKGIRMITGVPTDVRAKLMGDSVAGYTVEEYGTLLAFADSMQNGSLTLEDPYAKSNYAYKKGVSDAVFEVSGNLTQYTNVVVNFTMEQCSKDIAMRPYMKLKDAEGNEVTVYGGILYRNIGYVAWQNRNAFHKGTAGHTYIWDIIEGVYQGEYPES